MTELRRVYLRDTVVFEGKLNCGWKVAQYINTDLVKSIHTLQFLMRQNSSLNIILKLYVKLINKQADRSYLSIRGIQW